MFNVSTDKFLKWKEKQLLKGSDKQSLDLLIDSVGSISKKELNLLKIKSNKTVTLEFTLDSIEFLWNKHIFSSIPIQYLTGVSYWRNLKLEVSNKVLIPRPETELIIDIVLEEFKNKDEKIIFADLGTGSGAISIALALAKPFWNGVATDIDKNAVEIALRNFSNYSNKSNLTFHYGHWWEPIKYLRGKIDLVIANPPYIPQDIYSKLSVEVKDFEPKIALLGGVDGLEHINEIVRHAPLFLKEKGCLLLEHHYDQGDKVKKLFLEYGLTSVRVLKDFSGIGRFTIGRYK